jgi:hypothetical protein
MMTLDNDNSLKPAAGAGADEPDDSTGSARTLAFLLAWHHEQIAYLARLANQAEDEPLQFDRYEDGELVETVLEGERREGFNLCLELVFLLLGNPPLADDTTENPSNDEQCLLLATSVQH